LDPNVEIVYRKMYIAFRINKKNIVSIHLFVNSLNIWLYWRYGTIKDDYWIIRDVSWVWNYGNAENEIKIVSDKDIIRIFDLINQTYTNQK
jgi:predicted transport protein